MSQAAQTCTGFGETIEDPKGHVSVPFFVPFFPIAMKSNKALDPSELLCGGNVIGLSEPAVP